MAPRPASAGRGRGPRQREGEGHFQREPVIFNAFERMVAFRYLRARRQEGFVSVIAIFSLLGIALGVATLIIVMSVMDSLCATILVWSVLSAGYFRVYGERQPLASRNAT